MRYHDKQAKVLPFVKPVAQKRLLAIKVSRPAPQSRRGENQPRPAWLVRAFGNAFQ